MNEILFITIVVLTGAIIVSSNVEHTKLERRIERSEIRLDDLSRRLDDLNRRLNDLITNIDHTFWQLHLRLREEERNTEYRQNSIIGRVVGFLGDLLMSFFGRGRMH